jgi:GH24 family phage-related lysozyme (muramidase)
MLTLWWHLPWMWSLCITNVQQNTNVLQGRSVQANSEALRILRIKKTNARLQQAERTVKRVIERELLDNQFSALVCMAYDNGKLPRKLVRMINDARPNIEHDWWLVNEELKAIAGTEKKPHKQRRRRQEYELFVLPCLVVNRPGSRNSPV